MIVAKIICFEPARGILYEAYLGAMNKYRLVAAPIPIFVNGMYGYCIKQMTNKVPDIRLYELIGYRL